MHIPLPGDPTPIITVIHESMMAMQNNNSHPTTANGDDDIGVGNKLNFYPAVDEDYETRRAEQQAESLIPLKEDLAEWIQRLIDIPITTDTFLQALDNGAALCRLAFLIQSKAEEASREGKCPDTIPRLRFRCRENAKSRTWYARDNTANFLRWCRDFGINEGCMFESEDLVCHRQEKPVVVCLLELARLGYRFGLEPPSIIKIEKEIEREESELASQMNDDDPNEGVTDEAAGDEAGGSESGAKNEVEAGEEEEEAEEGEEKEEEIDGENEEDETNQSADGLNGNLNDGSVSEGNKSRATSRAMSHVSGPNDNGENDGEEGEEEDGDKDDGEEEEEKEENNDDEKESEEVNGTVNSTSEDENANEKDDDSSLKSKSNRRSNSPTKSDSGPTSPSRRSPTSPRSRIDNIKSRQLDKKVKYVASEHNVSEHVNQISEGKYCIFGRVVFIRLLKEKHLMVRVGGGWDTLDHYLSHHSPTKILEFKRNDQVKTPNTSSRHDPDTGETAATNNTGDEKYLVISGKYKRN